MKAEDLVKKLAAEFGSDNVRVCSEYHVQVSTSKGWNDIWLNKYGELKWKPNGSRTAVNNITLDTLKKRLKVQKKTHLEKMREILNLPEFIKKTEKLSTELKIKTAFFVDAGFKDGKAKAACIFINNGDIDVKVRNIKAENSYEAECYGIDTAIIMNRMHSGPIKFPIFTDNQTASQEYQKQGYDVRWIPRKENKVADSLSNMRHK